MRLFATAMLVLALIVSAATAVARAAQSAPEGFYGEEQARRGKTQVASSCAACHTAAAAGQASRAANGPDRVTLPLVGSDVIRKWRTVGDLFSKVRRTMPANNANGLSDDAYLDIVAYMLHVNGLRAGKSLTPQVNSLHKLVLAKPGAGKVAVNSLATAGLYTAEQATRGEAYFLGNCHTCHTTNPAGFTDADRASGYKGGLLGGRYQTRIIDAGAERLQRWGNVFNLFNKVQQTMPAHDPGGLSVDTYVDLTAYLLKVYGAPAGTEELAFNVNAMKSMMLNEPGFEKAFNGKDFSGIRFVLGANCTPRPIGCAQTSPTGAFRVEDGVIVSTGTPEGYWYADKKYLNFTLRADYRYTRPPALERDEDFLGNSGYLLFITEHGVWPKCIEIQGQNLAVMNAFGVGAQLKSTVDNEARRRAIRPVGEWNSIEIVARDGRVMTDLNGTPIATVTEHEFKEPGYIGFQSEGGEIRWRNIRIKAE